MALDVLNPVHIKRISKTGTIGVIDYTDFDKEQHHWCDPDYWGVLDHDSFDSLPYAGGYFKDQTGCFIGDSLYVYGGENGSYQKTGQTLRYTITDPVTGQGSWTTRATGQARKEASMSTDGVNCYAFGGLVGTGGGSPTNTLSRYTVASNSWSVLTNNFGPTPCSRHSTCYLDGYFYTYGGWPNEQSTTGYDQLWRYDVTKSDNTGWEQMQGSGYPMINMVIVPWNGKLYSFGGVDPVAFFLGGGITTDEVRTTKNILIFDPQTNTWNEGSYCPFVGCETNGEVYNDKLYIAVATSAAGESTNAIWVYDFVRDIWSKRFPGGQVHTQGAVSIHQATGNVYMYGMTNTYNNKLEVWYNNDLTLAIRKV